MAIQRSSRLLGAWGEVRRCLGWVLLERPRPWFLGQGQARQLVFILSCGCSFDETFMEPRLRPCARYLRARLENEVSSLIHKLLWLLICSSGSGQARHSAVLSQVCVAVSPRSLVRRGLASQSSTCPPCVGPHSPWDTGSEGPTLSLSPGGQSLPQQLSSLLGRLGSAGVHASATCDSRVNPNSSQPHMVIPRFLSVIGVE